MSEFFNQFHLLRPVWLLALLPMILILLMLWRRERGAAAWSSVCDPELLPHLLLKGDDGGGGRLPLLLLGLAWLLAILALAGPTWERLPQPVFQAYVERVLVLDLSPSMNARDLAPSRLERARFKLRDILEQSREERTALVVFGDEPHVVTPLTDDVATIEAMLHALTVDIIPAPGDAGAPALEMAGELLKRGVRGRGDILLITDGVADMASSLAVINKLNRQGMSVSVLGVGTEVGAPVPRLDGRTAENDSTRTELARLNPRDLKALAATGGGHYSLLTSDETDLQQVLMESELLNLGEAEKQQGGVERWVEQGSWLLLPLLLIAAAAFRRGWIGAFLVVLILPPPVVQAFEMDDLWQRPDQRAAIELKQGRPESAAELFQDTGWQGTARYRSGDFKGAAASFTGEVNAYNRGNALARSGEWQQAIEAYDEALKRQPGDRDAQFNRDLLEKLLQQRQQSEQEGGSGQSGEEDGEGQPQPGSDDAESDEEQKSEQKQSDKNGNEAPGETSGEGDEPGGEDAEDEEGDRSATGGESIEDERQGETKPGEQQTDTAEAAKRDVMPSQQPEQAAENSEQASGIARQDESGELPDEKELALEQWLRQIPDDPSGLLRRKFMLEHLLREKRGE